jgi:hypothetical protein
MATNLKVVHVSVSHTVPNNDPNSPSNTPAQTLKDLADKVKAAIADTSDGQPDLSTGFQIVKVIPIASGATASKYEVWVTN